MNYKLIKFLESDLRDGKLYHQTIKIIKDLPDKVMYSDEKIIQYIKDNNIPLDEDYCIVEFDENGYVRPYAMLFGEFESDEEFCEAFLDCVEWDYRIMCEVAFKE